MFQIHRGLHLCINSLKFMACSYESTMHITAAPNGETGSLSVQVYHQLL